MPLVVLRNKDKSLLPYLLAVGPDGLVDPSWQDAGWSIDADADPVLVEQEIYEAQQAAREKAAANPPEVRFAPRDGDQPVEQPPAALEKKSLPSSINPPAQPVTEGN